VTSLRTTSSATPTTVSHSLRLRESRFPIGAPFGHSWSAIDLLITVTFKADPSSCAVNPRPESTGMPIAGK
jgi:hypothetical protein